MAETLIELRVTFPNALSGDSISPRDWRTDWGPGFGKRPCMPVDRVNLSVTEQEVVGLVGESGCGKSTLGRMTAGILEKSEGSVSYRGRVIDTLTGTEARRVKLNLQMIFQDPFASLNPRMQVKDIIGEAPLVHGLISRSERDGYLDDLMLRVGLDPEFKNRFPHQFSGGQRQRVGIARALAVKPEFIVCDEPIAALDVSIQAQILNLFTTLREDLGLTYLFISHDLGVVQHLSDRVAIMYLGRIARTGTHRRTFQNAEPSLHPGAARRGAQHRQTSPPFRTGQRRDPLSVESAAGMSFSSPLSARHATLP